MGYFYFSNWMGFLRLCKEQCSLFWWDWLGHDRVQLGGLVCWPSNHGFQGHTCRLHVALSDVYTLSTV
ncbi:hypothetical protein NC651_013868 [Populus alba x Populus x berolinensis]|nr:hypothetical protein NC651_013868 [Populus alba x Populus x berolinensis]